MATNGPLTLPALHELANLWCPAQARWNYLLAGFDHWGPAHELAHALLSRPDERVQLNYGLCEAGYCSCLAERCYGIELAAQRISWRLLAVVGREDLAREDIDATDYYDLMATPANWAASWYLLRTERLWPLPSTINGLARLLERRLGASSAA